MSLDNMLKQLVGQAIQELLPALVQEVAKHVAPAPAPAQQFGGFGAAAQPAAQPQPFAGFAAPATIQPAATVAVTPEMVQAVIIPHINGANGEQAKMLFGQQMAAMGLANLQDATAAQLPELYARFQQVAGQLGAAGVAQGSGAAPSII